MGLSGEAKCVMHGREGEVDDLVLQWIETEKGLKE